MRKTAADLFDTLNLLEMTPDLVCIAGSDGYFKRVNKAVIKKLGYTKKELFAREISSFIYEEDKERTRENREKLLNGGTLQNFQNRYVTKQGAIIWLEWTSIYFSDKEVVLAIAKDITEKKENEKALLEQNKTFKKLTTYFKGSIELDRKHFAYELHEEIAQLAAAVKMNIDIVSSVSPGLSDGAKQGLLHASATASMLIQRIQNMSIAMSPYMLEEFGLDVTINWLCEELAKRHQKDCSYHSAYDHACLTKEIQIDFFRICQKALDNVVQHADATKVKIRITDDEQHIHLSIKDNGKGFNPATTKHMGGLVSIKERVSSIDGVLTIRSRKKHGTTIHVSIPKSRP